MITQFANRCAEKMAKMEEEAIIELIYLTGFNTHAFNLKWLEGARYAIKRIKEEGYNIISIETGDISKITYILQRYGKTIARRDVCMKIEIVDEAKEGDIK